ncbi:hypothetical protein L202_05155 [Cryptococcus amylolentus CBS 6039]|uniref:Uncharacterized protein n=2 Tax=Cryptococcus amylolentus TaxID=104669 RepID=A0A1E3HJG5_9TREE|nr:hypothetical protein L202_05155 [Cryptococcus amylolentus CBS 6039]ODN76489.1 hypothetical protein L202_05155 [Cryptococcus amylolentus CBS 6039]ODO04480.1 hypothetical protein I350_05082 [Cryptococcus amylolentus CBS 6273]
MSNPQQTSEAGPSSTPAAAAAGPSTDIFPTGHGAIILKLVQELEDVPDEGNPKIKEALGEFLEIFPKIEKVALQKEEASELGDIKSEEELRAAYAKLRKRTLELNSAFNSLLSVTSTQFVTLADFCVESGAKAAAFKNEMAEKLRVHDEKMISMEEEQARILKEITVRSRCVSENRVLKMEAQKLRSQVINLEKELRKAKKS